MASAYSSKLSVFCSRSKDQDAIPQSSVFSPTSIFEPPSHFPATLLRNNLLANHISDVLATKLAELAPSSRKQTFLRDIGYVGCSTENVAYLCKKDSPVLQPLEIRLESEIKLLETIRYDWNLQNKTKSATTFLALFTEQEMHCYEARPIEHEEIDLVPSFTVDTPTESLITCVMSTKTRRVFCGTNKGEVCELRTDARDRRPMWSSIGDNDSSTSPISALRQDQGKGLVYALHADSSVDVFLYRFATPGEMTRRIGGFHADPSKHVSIVELFPMPSTDEDAAHLLGVSKDGVLFNFEMDLRSFRPTLSFVKKLLRSASSASQSLSLVHQSTSLSTRLCSEDEERRVAAIGYYEGLVVAMPSSEEGNPTIELYSASRLPASEDSHDAEPARVVFFKEPIRLDGTFVSMHSASEDDNTRLFEGLDLGGDELSRQVFLKGNKFVLLTENRVIDVRKRCPVEVLMEILQEHDPERVDEFFRLYGPLETATMAVQLAAARGDDHARRLLLDDHRLSAMFFSTEAHNPDELSLPTRAILSYFRRLMNPLWERPLFCARHEGWRKEGAKMTSSLTTAQLDWFSGSLEELRKFVEVYVEEFRAVRFFDGSIYAPKCPSILREFELLFNFKDIVTKCTEIINLVRIYEEARPVDVSDRQMKTFTKKPLQSFVFTNESPSGPIQVLITSMLAGKDPEVQEAITFKMDNEIPNLCNAKDKIYKKALSLLKKAKISPRLERQEILVSKAMNLLGDNCEERHIDAIIAALADLQRHYEVLQFVSKTAKKLVPEPATSDAAVQKKAQHLRRRCYDRVFQYVADYIQNIDMDDDASLDIPVLYGAVQYLDDRHMMQMMMEKLLAFNKVPKRQLHQPSYTEFGIALKQYISQKVMNVSSLHEVKEQVGVPLSAPAEQEVRLLVAICQSQEEMKQAGDWLMLLAKRASRNGRNIPLIERIGDLNDAKAMYKTVMPESFMRQIEKEIELAMFQQRVLTMGTRIFAIMNDVHDNGQDVRDVMTRLVGADVLYRVIRDNFPDKTSQDLTDELQRIAREGFEVVSGDDTLTES